MGATGIAEKLIVALDVDDPARAQALIESLSPQVGHFKVGSVLFTREGPSICRAVKDSGARLFLDLKFHDIPNTVRGAVRSALDLGADMLTVHASGGAAMLRSAVEAREEAGAKALLVAVTVLTHLSLADFGSLFASGRDPEATVLALARTARDAGIDGVVASARELPLIKGDLGAAFKVVTPGIRLPGSGKDDQARVVTPREAVRAGADYIVVGRPITAALDPAGACRQILGDMVS